MKLMELKSILHSNIGNIQWAIVYDLEHHTEIESGCSIEYAVKKYGEYEVKHIQAYQDQLVITI